MKKNKTLIIGIIVIAIILVGLFLYTGRARTDVYLKDFEVSSDGKTMILEVGVSNSAGYVRKMKRTSGSMNYYYTFYSTYGINSKVGSKDTFQIELDENVDEIYFYTGDKGYKLVLVKNYATQSWEKISYADNGLIKLNLLDKNKLNYVTINTYAQNANYFEFNDKNTIEKIYDIFDNLETDVSSKTFNPDNPEEMYMVAFYEDDPKDLVMKYWFDIYRKNGKYYVEQRYNGIYEITEEDFNMIKSYVK